MEASRHHLYKAMDKAVSTVNATQLFVGVSSDTRAPFYAPSPASMSSCRTASRSYTTMKASNTNDETPRHRRSRAAPPPPSPAGRHAQFIDDVVRGWRR